jgi:hypothetical protein
MYHPRHVGPHPYLVPVAVAAGVVLAALAFGLTVDRDPAPSAGREVTTPSGSRSPSSEDAVPAASKGPGAFDRCRDQHEAQSPAQRTAARAMKQWELHVGAMNQLVAGEITLDQASAFWNQTRVGAQRRIADFRRADKAYRGRDRGCPASEGSGATTWRACARAVALRDKVHAVARRAIATWAEHVRDMERLRSGQLSPTMATEMWQMSWRMGQDQIDAYHDALRRAERTDGCAG